MLRDSGTSASVVITHNGLPQRASTQTCHRYKLNKIRDPSLVEITWKRPDCAHLWPTTSYKFYPFESTELTVKMPKTVKYLSHMSEENNLGVSLDTWLTDVNRNIQKYEFYRRKPVNCLAWLIIQTKNSKMTENVPKNCLPDKNEMTQP